MEPESRIVAAIGRPFDRNFPAEIECGACCGYPFADVATIFTFTLSDFPFGHKGVAEVLCELAITVPKYLDPGPFSDVLNEIAQRLLERFHDTGERPVLGSVLQSEALIAISRQAGWTLAAVRLGYSVWLPESVAWTESAASVLAIIELIPVSDVERLLIESDPDRFEALTAEGTIDLLDFGRASSWQREC